MVFIFYGVILGCTDIMGDFGVVFIFIFMGGLCYYFNLDGLHYCSCINIDVEGHA